MEPSPLRFFLGLLQNSALLILGVLGYSWIRGLIAAWPRQAREPAEGSICLALAILCMAEPMWLGDGVRIDARNAMVTLATLFGGPLAGVVTAVPTATYRLWLGGSGAASGAASVIATYLASFAVFVWLHRTKRAMSYRHLAVLALMVAATMVATLGFASPAVALDILERAGVPGLTIVPGAVFLLGALALRLDRGRAAEHDLRDKVRELVAAQGMLAAREATLRRHQQALVAIVRANVLMERRLPAAEAVRAITELAGEMIGAEYTTVAQADLARGVLRCVDDWTRMEARHDRLPEIDLREYGDLLRDLEREQVIVIADPLADPRVAARTEILQARGARSGLLAGFFLGSELRGLVAFVTVAPRQWNAEEMAFARSIADLVGLVFVTSELREALAALDLAGNAIYVENQAGRIIYANGPARALVAREAVPGEALVDPGAFPRPPGALVRERDTCEIAWSGAEGPCDLEIRRSRLPEGGIVTVIDDVTRRKAAAREHERLGRQLEQAGKMEAIGQLAGGIAHDFNNLLGAVIGFARFLEQDLPTRTPQHGFAQRILAACVRGRELVAQILAFARARPLERHPVDLRAVLREAEELLRASLPATTRLDVDGGAEAVTVAGDEAQLQQVVVNLCLNAHDALGGQPGKIAVRLSTMPPEAADREAAVMVGHLASEKGYARLDVVDTGFGIAPEHLARVFEPFFTTKERGRGTGLGLAIVHGIIASYDGACAVESGSGIGTRFSVYLPLAERPGAAAATLGSEAEDLSGRERVLVVDDEPDITDMMSIGLERLGYEVATVNDPVEALEAFQEAPEAWDVVVTDQIMPGMPGLTLARRLRGIRAELPIILCTGLDDGVVGRRAREEGVARFFAKPVEPAEIAAAIRELARNR